MGMMAQANARSAIVKLSLYGVLLYLSGIFTILTPLPFLYVYFKDGRRSFGVAVAVSVSVVFLLHTLSVGTAYEAFLPRLLWYPDSKTSLGVVFGIAQYLLYMVVAGLIAQAWRASRSVHWLFWRLAVVFFLVCATLAAATALIDGRSLYAMLRESLGIVIHDLAEIQSAQGGPVVLSLSQEERIVDVIMQTLFGASFAWLFIIALINSAFFSRFFGQRLAAKDMAGLGRFSQWRVPFYAVWVLIVAVALLLLNSYGGDSRNPLALWPILVDTASNVLVILLALYWLQGVAIARFFVKKWQWGMWMQVILYLTIGLFFQVMGPLLLGLGFFDTWINSRERVRNDV